MSLRLEAFDFCIHGELGAFICGQKPDRYQRIPLNAKPSSSTILLSFRSVPVVEDMCYEIRRAEACAD
jgi:hypothetical protein